MYRVEELYYTVQLYTSIAHSQQGTVYSIINSSGTDDRYSVKFVFTVSYLNAHLTYPIYSPEIYLIYCTVYSLHAQQAHCTLKSDIS